MFLIFHSPIALRDIKKKIATGQIKTITQLQIDLLIMSFNAVLINASDTIVFSDATDLQSDLYTNCQVCELLLLLFY